jgi:hypothetical protein
VTRDEKTETVGGMPLERVNFTFVHAPPSVIGVCAPK